MAPLAGLPAIFAALAAGQPQQQPPAAPLAPAVASPEPAPMPTPEPSPGPDALSTPALTPAQVSSVTGGMAPPDAESTAPPMPQQQDQPLLPPELRQMLEQDAGNTPLDGMSAFRMAVLAGVWPEMYQQRMAQLEARRQGARATMTNLMLGEMRAREMNRTQGDREAQQAKLARMALVRSFVDKYAGKVDDQTAHDLLQAAMGNDEAAFSAMYSRAVNDVGARDQKDALRKQKIDTFKNFSDDVAKGWMTVEQAAEAAGLDPNDKSPATITAMNSLRQAQRQGREERAAKAETTNLRNAALRQQMENQKRANDLLDIRIEQMRTMTPEQRAQYRVSLLQFMRALQMQISTDSTTGAVNADSNPEAASMKFASVNSSTWLLDQARGQLRDLDSIQGDGSQNLSGMPLSQAVPDAFSGALADTLGYLQKNYTTFGMTPTQSAGMNWGKMKDMIYLQTAPKEVSRIFRNNLRERLIGLTKNPNLPELQRALNDYIERNFSEAATEAPVSLYQRTLGSGESEYAGHNPPEIDLKGTE